MADHLLPSGDEPRTFAAIALHADIVRDQARAAQHDWRELHNLPGFTSHAPSASLQLDSSCRREPYVHFLPQRDDHIRFLEHVVERLAAQVSELAQRLADQENPAT